MTIGASDFNVRTASPPRKKGETYVYRVRIIGERGNDTENRSGEVTYKVKSTRLGEIRLAMTSKMKYEAMANVQKYVLLSGRHVRFHSNADGAKAQDRQTLQDQNH